MSNFNPLNFIANHAGMNIADAIKEAYEQGTRDAEPERKTSKWIKNDNGTWSCDHCQSWIPDEQHHYARFCLFCGAKMKGEQNESAILPR